MRRPTVSVIPSSDTAFREHVERLTARHAFQNAAELASRLRALFPRVVVRPSEVSGQADTWYVYRDGVWRGTGDDRWWEDPRSPRVVVSRDGWIEEANGPARAVLGLTAADDLPRFFADFVAPGGLEDAMDLFAVVAGGRKLSATTLLRPASGEVIACDLKVWPEGERLIGAFRLADDIALEPMMSARTEVQLVCHPSADLLFARYASEALARMPEPTPDGLALRLRRLYPHARVDAGGSAWKVFRDASDAEGSPDEWWHAPHLATVTYDGHGRIIGANDEAERLLGRALVGQHWQDLVTPGTTEQVTAVLRLIAEAGWAVSRFRMPGPDGYFFEFDSYTKASGDTFVTIMRPRSASGELRAG